MAHKKAGGAKANQGSNVIGKRLGFKVASGETVKPGQIIIRQRGRTFIPGKNVDMGRDYTIFSKVIGIVEIVREKRLGNKKKINVIEQS
jgi:large subunit ribosomal protein L27